MDEVKKWYWDGKAERTCEALKERGFKANYLADGKAACEFLTKMIDVEALVAWGGSATLDEIGILTVLKERSQPVIDVYEAGITSEEGIARRRQTLTADIFLCSTNAVTEDGVLVNTDGVGNRIAAMIFGPHQVYIVAGLNKIVPDVQAGLARIF